MEAFTRRCGSIHLSFLSLWLAGRHEDESYRSEMEVGSFPGLHPASFWEGESSQCICCENLDIMMNLI